MSGILVYVVVMAGAALVLRDIPMPIRQKYWVSCLVLVLGGIAGMLLFPEKVDKLLTATQTTPLFYEERAHNWNYFRWELLDEYPIVFGTFTPIPSHHYCEATQTWDFSVHGVYHPLSAPFPVFDL